MKFNKYKEWGDYHWQEYKSQTTYGKHANKVAAWVTERKVLDVGAGDGLITSLLKAEGIDDELLAVDLAQEHNQSVWFGDAYNLTDFYGKYEAVFMGDVLEHLEFPHRVLYETRRVAPVLYITTPPRDVDRDTPKDKYHYQEWTPDELKKFVEAHGYKLDGEIIIKYHRMYAHFISV